jgi:hypothetical protein
MEDVSPQVYSEPEHVDGDRPLLTTADIEASPVVSVRSEFSTVVIFATASLVWFWLLVSSALDRGPAVETEAPYVVAVFAVIWGVGMIVRSRLAVPRLNQLPMRGTQSMWFTVSHLLATALATIWLIVGLASCAVVIAAQGSAITNDPPPREVTVGEVHQHLAWEVIDALPVVDLPDTLGWERPIEDPAAPLGVLAVVARGVFLLVVLKLVVALVRLSRPQPPESPDALG